MLYIRHLISRIWLVSGHRMMIRKNFFVLFIILLVGSLLLFRFWNGRLNMVFKISVVNGAASQAIKRMFTILRQDVCASFQVHPFSYFWLAWIIGCDYRVEARQVPRNSDSRAKAKSPRGGQATTSKRTQRCNSICVVEEVKVCVFSASSQFVRDLTPTNTRGF
jgi:hypothetical protein